MATRKTRPPESKASLSSDWYWEQDAELRFVRVEVQTGAPGEQELAQKNLGRRPWETGLSVEGGWEAHRELLGARAPFREVLMWRDFDDASRRYISVSGQPVFDAKGRFTGYRGVGRDITRQKRSELLLRLQHSVTRGLAEADGPLAGVESALRAVCETEGWDCGELWRVDEAKGVLRRFAYWAAPGIAAGQRFVEMSGTHAFQPGEGLIGSVWQSGAPLWIADSTKDARATRKAIAEQTGLHAALLCPIPVGGRMTGVIAFACRRIRPPDEALLQALMVLATQLGLYLRRMDSEARLRESEERFRRTFELAGSGLAHFSLEHRFLRVNRKLCEILGYSESELIGRPVQDVSHPEDTPRASAERERLYAGELDSLSMEKRYVRKDGSLVWAVLNLALERDADGKPLYEIAVYEDITARKAAEEALRDSEARFRHTFELAGVGVAHIGPDRRFQRVNRRFCEILGYSAAELIGRTGRDLSHPEDLDAMNAQRPSLYAGTIDAVRGEKRYLRRDGSVVWVAYTLAIERDSAGNPQYEIAVYDDISARKAAEEALRESEARFRALTEMSSDFFWETDAQHRLTDMVYGRSFAGKVEHALGKPAWEVPSTHPDQAGWAALRAKVDAHEPFRDFEFGRPRSNGAVRYFSVSGAPRLAADGGFLGYRGVGRDITDLALARERIASLAYQDALTGLANRTSLAPALEQAVERTRRRGSKLAGLFLDLDGFKEINDLHGHDAGDRLLVEAAQRLRAVLRSSDPLARLGGDEFFVVLEDLQSNLPAERVAQKLLAALMQPYDLGADRQARISASIGISVYPDDAGDAAALIKHADSAMYSAKQAGKNAYRFFVIV
jgi:diguanylate cyclase (GGDEF)-like protein/PAS domain S-box-containing protein